jgi:hypothetical protein
VRGHDLANAVFGKLGLHQGEADASARADNKPFAVVGAFSHFDSVQKKKTRDSPRPREVRDRASRVKGMHTLEVC